MKIWISIIFAILTAAAALGCEDEMEASKREVIAQQRLAAVRAAQQEKLARQKLIDDMQEESRRTQDLLAKFGPINEQLRRAEEPTPAPAPAVIRETLMPLPRGGHNTAKPYYAVSSLPVDTNQPPHCLEPPDGADKSCGVKDCALVYLPGGRQAYRCEDLRGCKFYCPAGPCGDEAVDSRCRRAPPPPPASPRRRSQPEPCRGDQEAQSPPGIRPGGIVVREEPPAPPKTSPAPPTK